MEEGTSQVESKEVKLERLYWALQNGFEELADTNLNLASKLLDWAENYIRRGQ